MDNFANVFGEFMKTPNTISVDNYVLKPNEQIVGETIVCSKCGELKRTKRFSQLYNEWIWMPQHNDGAGNCECEREAIRKKAFEESSKEFRRIYDCDFLKDLVGKTYCDLHFSDLEKLPNSNTTYQNALVSCEKYVENIDTSILKRGLGMYLYSKNAGTGKSTLMACLRNGLIAKNVKCVFVNEADLIKFAKDTRTYIDENGWFTYSLFKTVDVLILDDIGVSNLSNNNAYAEWRNGILYDLIEKRNRDGLCTLFTSNYSPEDLNKQRGIDFKTVDRINARSSRIICITAESFRGGNISVGD